MARSNSHFAQGSAVYTCRICKRKTRATGRGDNDGVELCAECYDLAGEENHQSDYGGEFYNPPAETLRLIQAVADKGGKTSAWGALKATAEKALAAKT